MTTFQQALHIFRKDARHLRWEIAGAFFLLLILIFSGVQTWESLQERGYPDPGDETPLSIFLIVAWSLMIARSIQTEALPGDRHFWLTRPYSRPGLVLSKALFIFAFINLPLMTAQALILLFNGLPVAENFGGLMWNQVLLTVLVLLPVTAIASLTRNLAQFLPATVLAAGIIVPIIGEHRRFGDLEWIRASLGFVIAGVIASFAVWRQYRLRRSANTALLALAASVCGVIFYLSFPGSVAFAIQSQLIGSRDARFALRLGPPPPRPPDTRTANRYQQRLSFPIAVSGVDLQDLRLSSSRVVFRTLSGVTRRSSARAEVKDHRLVYSTSVDREFFDAAKDSPVTVRGEFSVIQFGNARSSSVPLDGTPVHLAGLGQCGVVAAHDERRIVCRAAFQRPKSFISESISRDDRSHDAYSPFPAQLRIYPVVARSYRLAGHEAHELAPAAPERPAILVVRDPVAYFRYTMEVPNVRLGDYAMINLKDDDDQ